MSEPTPPPRWRQPPVYIAGAVLLALLAVVGIWQLRSDPDQAAQGEPADGVDAAASPGATATAAPASPDPELDPELDPGLDPDAPADATARPSPGAPGQDPGEPGADPGATAGGGPPGQDPAEPDDPPGPTYTAGQFRLTGVEVGSGPQGRFQVAATVHNTGDRADYAGLKVRLYRGGQEVGQGEVEFQDLEEDERRRLVFETRSPYVDGVDRLEFELDFVISF